MPFTVVAQILAKSVRDGLFEVASAIRERGPSRAADSGPSERSVPLQAELFNRAQAARYSHRSPRSFDRTLRLELKNVGSKRRPLYARSEIDARLSVTSAIQQTRGES